MSMFHWFMYLCLWLVSISVIVTNFLMNGCTINAPDSVYQQSITPLLYIQCESNPPGFSGIFPPIRQNFTCQLYVPICARLQTFINLSSTLTMLCLIKRDHPVHIICAKCQPSGETHAAFFDIFPKWLGIFSPNFTCLLKVPIYARMQIFIQLPPTVTKFCHIKCDHPACVSADGGHFERLIWHNFVKVADN